MDKKDGNKSDLNDIMMLIDIINEVMSQVPTAPGEIVVVEIAGIPDITNASNEIEVADDNGSAFITGNIPTFEA